MPQIPDSTIQRVRESTDLVRIIGEYVGRENLKPKSGSFWTCCPFHKEKTPSFHVDTNRQTYKCFGCGAGGDAFKFVSETQGISFPESVALLAEKANIRLEYSATDPKAPLKKELFRANELAASFFQETLKSSKGKEAREYLRNRKIGQEMIDLFRLGFAPDSWDETGQMLRHNGVSDEVAEHAGLVIAREDGVQHYDRFRGRIIFPVMGLDGRVLGMMGRVLEDNPRTAKYVNSTESAIFTKGKVLYGLNFGLKAVRDSKRMIIVEGNTDVVHAHQAGDLNVVAVMGGLSEEHANTLRTRFLDTKITWCFDSDKGGKTHFVSAAGRMLGHGDMDVCLLPNGKDPANIYQEGGKIGTYLSKTIPFFDYVIECATTDEEGVNINIKDPAGLTRFLKNISGPLSGIPADRRAIYFEVLTQRTGVSASALERAIRGDYDGTSSMQSGFVSGSSAYWQSRLLRQLLSVSDQQGIISSFADRLRIDDFDGDEKKAVAYYVLSLTEPQKKIEFDTGSALFLHSDMPKICEKIVTVAAERGVIVSPRKIQEEFFEAYPQMDFQKTVYSPKLEDITRSYTLWRAARIVDRTAKAFSAGASPDNLARTLEESYREIGEVR